MAIKNPGRSSRAKAAENRKKDLELRTPGLSYRQIGEQLGVSKVCAYKHVPKAIEALENESREDAKVYRRLDLERLDWIIRDTMKQSLKGEIQQKCRHQYCLSTIAKLIKEHPGRTLRGAVGCQRYPAAHLERGTLSHSQGSAKLSPGRSRDLQRQWSSVRDLVSGMRVENEMVRIIGRAKTITLEQAFGDGRNYLARYPRQDSDIVRVVGMAAAQALGQWFAGMQVYIPQTLTMIERNRAIVRDVLLGDRMTIVAQRYRLVPCAIRVSVITSSTR